MSIKKIGTLKSGRVRDSWWESLKFCSNCWEKGGVASVVAIATAKLLISKRDLEHLKALDLENLS